MVTWPLMHIQAWTGRLTVVSRPPSALVIVVHLIPQKKCAIHIFWRSFDHLFSSPWAFRLSLIFFVFACFGQMTTYFQMVFSFWVVQSNRNWSFDQFYVLPWTGHPWDSQVDLRHLHREFVRVLCQHATHNFRGNIDTWRPDSWLGGRLPLWRLKFRLK